MTLAHSSPIDRFAGAVGARLDGSPLAVMLDIDGTMAPIAPTPDTAVVPPATREVVRRLVQLPDVHVALVTGRSVADALRMTRVEGASIVGNHGLELLAPTGEVSAVDEARVFEDAIATASIALAPLARSAPGAIVENKRWTLCLHYRLVAADEIPALLDRARHVGRELGLRVTEGKKTIELRPPIDDNKGTAAVAFAQRVGALEDGGSILAAGDDHTDEDIFRALMARTSHAVTVHILGAARDDHVAVATGAELVLASPLELQRALEWLVARRAR